MHMNVASPARRLNGYMYIACILMEMLVYLGTLSTVFCPKKEKKFSSFSFTIRKPSNFSALSSDFCPILWSLNGLPVLCTARIPTCPVPRKISEVFNHVKDKFLFTLNNQPCAEETSKQAFIFHVTE